MINKKLDTEFIKRWKKHYGECESLEQIVSAACLTKHQREHQQTRNRRANLNKAREKQSNMRKEPETCQQ